MLLPSAFSFVENTLETETARDGQQNNGADATTQGTPFGQRPSQQPREAKKAVEVATSSPDEEIPKGKRIFVDITVERAIMVRYSTLVFRPNEELKPDRDKIKIALAKEHKIPLRFK